MPRHQPRSFRRVPDALRHQIAALETPAFVLFTVLDLDKAVIEAGEWTHLGIRMAPDGVVHVPEAVLPDRGRGVWSRRNQDGWT